MYRNFCPGALGVSGRQSELIELALTYSFRGFDVDMGSLARRSESQGADHACRFIRSARVNIGGFELPIRWNGPEIDFRADLAHLGQIAEVAASIDARRCYTTLMPATDELPYHENFEFHRTRLGEIAEGLANHNIRLGLAFLAAPAHREGKQYQFIHQAEPLITLIKTIGSPNVGIVLDTWNWFLGDGGLDQIRELEPEQVVMVRLADLPEGVDPASMDDSQRLLPGETESSQVSNVLSILAEKEYDGPVSVYPHPGCFSGMTRDAIVQRVANCLDELFKAAGLSKAGKVAVAATES